MHVPAAPAPEATPARPKPRRPGTPARLLRLGLAGLALWFGWDVWYMTGGPNLHAVVPGLVYRGAQLSPAALDDVIGRHGIRTVVNLRGCCQPEPWYLNQCRAVRDRDVSQEDVSFSAVHLPSKHELRQLVAVLDRTEYPIYLHCRHGADRTGMAAAIYMLLHTDTPYPTARRQLGLRYGHLPVGRTTQLDRFFDLYEGWLRDAGREHAPEQFRRWVLHEYEGGWCNGRIEAVRPLNGPLTADRPIGRAVTVRNLSRTTWHFSATSTAGTHLYYKLFDAVDGRPILEYRGGLVARAVGPGERTEVALVVPPLGRPGRYRLVIDLLDENHCWFGQVGAEPWEEELDIRE